MIVCPVTLVKVSCFPASSGRTQADRPRAPSQNWSSEIKKWLGRDRLRVFVADGTNNIKTFATNKSYNVLIVGYEKVPSSVSSVHEIHKLILAPCQKLRSAIDDVKYAQPPIGLIICDEGHRLKSTNTQITKALQTLSCMRRVILSGTPIQNNLGEFFAMMDFVNPGLLRDASYFKKNYEAPIMKSRDPNALPKDKAAGQDAADSLNEIQRNFVLRRTGDTIQKHLPKKRTSLLPPFPLASPVDNASLAGSTVEYTVFIVPTKLEIDLYAEVLSGSAVHSLLNGIGGKDQLSLLMLLRKCSNSPGLLMEQAERGDRILMVDGYNKGSPKNHFIFLLSSKSGGTGLNIIGASRLVLIDSDWNPSTDLQAMARIHRDGQTRECVLYRFLTAGTIDEKIFQRQVTKLALSGSVMASKARRNLSILRTWQHYDCSSEASIDTIDDALLRSLVYNRAATAAEHERVLEPIPGLVGERMLVRGGQVGFVFGKKSG
ncbi:SPOSA6832_04115 [Sporobolomyces salmonicolor]|uniref:SPOSA6832_04115-mRNA-1:cds n=1 Tax=Sporidiobolus salmonicolor TaxID=5005 RepID=A0A0D6ERB0_SPOSA|nr:SPOSA6832_04115 [Sporobolomyces salmonicolor]